VVETGEQCDDANPSNTDGCLTTCQRPAAWASGDVHLHSSGCDRYVDPAALVDRLRTMGLQVGSGLVWGNGFANDEAFFTGRDHPLSTPEVILHYDMEVSRFAAAKTGHLVLLGLDSLHYSEDMFGTPQSGVPIVDWARRQPRAVVGMAHAGLWPADGSFLVPPGGCCSPWETVVHAARGRLDFLSFERVPSGQGAIDAGSFRLWKAILDSGFRVAIAGGSDWLCTHQLDANTPRTDVILDGPLTYDNWLAGIKAGRTAVVNASGPGDRLNLRVDGHRLGEEAHLAAAGEVTVTLETAGPAPADVDVIVNGATVTRMSLAAGVQVAQVRVPVTRSAWVAARSQHVMTSPVYVLVGGQAIRASAEDTCYLKRSVQDLRAVITGGDIRLGESEAEALRAYDEAIAELQKRFTESGGTVCS
jgi:cysteine-rich repeat protein